MRDLVNAGNDSPADSLLVLLPVIAVLTVALLVVTAVAMNEEHGKVHDVEVRNRDGPALCATLDDLAAVCENICANRVLNQATSRHDLVASKSGRQAVWPRLNPVTEIVDVTSNTPPASGEESAAGLGLDVLEVRNLGIVGVGAKRVLLVVGRAEDEEAEANQGEHGNQSKRTQSEGMERQVASLLGVDKGDPDKVSEGKHHAKTISGDVHGSQDGRLEPPGVDNVESLHDGNDDAAIGNMSVVAVLLGAPGTVEDDPAHHTRAQLAPLLDVDLADEGNGDAGVQLAADEPVVEQVASVTAGSELSAVLAALLDAEAADVDKRRDAVRNQDAGSEELQVVLANENPNGELGALRKGTGSEERQCKSV